MSSSAKAPAHALPPRLAELQMQFAAVKADSSELVNGLKESQFNWRPNPQSWSMAECLLHLNMVGDRLRPGQRLRIIPIFQFDFLQKQVDRVFRLEPLRDQLPDAPRKTGKNSPVLIKVTDQALAFMLLHHLESRQMVRALVLAELRRRQPVIRRARRGLTQVPQARVSDWLSARHKPSGEMALRILNWVNDPKRK